MLKFFAVLSVSLTGLAAPALAGEAADAVRYFYDNPGSEADPANRDRFTGPALAFLNASDAAWDRDETICIDFGFSVDAQDFDEAEIARTLKLDETVDGDAAAVMANFDNFGQATQVEWRLKRTGAGWLVFDIASPVNDWRVSAMPCQ